MKDELFEDAVKVDITVNLTRCTECGGSNLVVINGVFKCIFCDGGENEKK